MFDLGLVIQLIYMTADPVLKRSNEVGLNSFGCYDACELSLCVVPQSPLLHRHYKHLWLLEPTFILRASPFSSLTATLPIRHFGPYIPHTQTLTVAERTTRPLKHLGFSSNFYSLEFYTQLSPAPYPLFFVRLFLSWVPHMTTHFQ